MALVKTFDKYDLQQEFVKMGRDYYSLDGYQAMLDLFDEVGNNTELDVIAICCEFNEDAPADIINNYDNIDEIKEAAGDLDALIDALNYYTFAVLLDNGNIFFQAF